MADTRIEWAHKVWNPITGCSPVSEGCQNCYARRMANRLRGRCGYPKENPFKVTLHPERLDEPLKWRKPRKVFVCSMSDLFHPDVPFDYITQVFDVMCSWRWPNKEAERIGDESLLEDPGHTYMVLTKRPERVQDWLQWLSEYWPGDSPVNVNLSVEGHFGRHIWFGVTAENQQRADERIPVLLQIPAAVRFVSVEPMLSPVRLILARRYCTNCNYLHWSYNPAGSGFVYKEVYCPECGFAYGYHSPEGNSSIDWVICGSESGQNRRPANIEWIRSLKNQCVDADVPFFLKQMEINGRLVKMPKLDGQVWDQMPEVE